MFILLLLTVLFYLTNDFLSVTREYLTDQDYKSWKTAVVMTIISYFEVITKIGLYVTGYVLTCEVLGNVVM